MLRRKYCEVCRDEREIKVTLYWPIEPIDFSAAMGQEADIKENSRFYPCPECGPKEPLEKVAFIQFAKVIHSSVPMDRPEVRADVIQDAKRRIMFDILEQAARQHLITFQIKETERFSSAGPWKEATIRGFMGIVSASHVKTLEERIKEGCRLAVASYRDMVWKWSRRWGIDSGLTDIPKAVLEDDLTRLEERLFQDWDAYEEANSKKGAR